MKKSKTSLKLASSPSLTCHRIRINPFNLQRSHIFKINDRVKNPSGLLGIITNQEHSQFIVKWDDNTFERIKIANPDNYLSYVETVESSIPPKLSNKKMSVKKKIPLPSASLAPDELVKLALAKGMIDEDNYDLELTKVSLFDEQALKQYRDEVNNYSIDGEVSSIGDEDVDVQGLSPEEAQAKRELVRLKSQRGISSSQSFSTAETRSLADISKPSLTFDDIKNGAQLSRPSSFEEALLQLDDDNYGTNNIDDSNYTNINADNFDSYDFGINDDIESFSDDNYNDISDYSIHNNSDQELSLESIIKQINADNAKPIPRETNFTRAASASSSSFFSTPIQGLTKPIVTNYDSFKNASFNDLFNLDWSTIGKKRS